MSTGAYSPDKILAHPHRLQELRKGNQPFPIHLQLILSDLCNLACEGCAYRLDGYPSSELFVEKHADGSVNRNPARFLETELAKSVLEDCAMMGTHAVQFSVWGEEHIPVIFEKSITRSVPIGPFVDSLFGTTGDGHHEVLDTRGRGLLSYAIDDEGRVVLGEIEAVYRHRAPEPLFEVTLVTGRSVFLTGSHGINVIRDGAIVKAPVRSLRVGERIACADWHGAAVAPQELPLPSLDKGAGLPRERIAVNAALFRLLGYFTAEGSASYQRGGVAHGLGWYFGTGPREDFYRSDVTRLCEEVFGAPAHPHPDKPDTALLLTSRQATEFFASLEALGTQAERRVPWIVWSARAPVEAKLEYLRGLFSGDGNFRSTTDSRGYQRNSLHLKTCNRGLAHDVFALLRQLGVHATLGSGRSKARKIEGRVLAPSAYYTVNVHDATSLRKLGPVLEGLRASPRYEESPHSHPGARRELEPFGGEAFAVPVQSVRRADELGRPVVYDITVAGTHRFLTASGVGCWNTGGGEPTLHKDCAALIDYAQCLGLDTALITNGIMLHHIGDPAVKTKWLRISIDAASPETYMVVRPSLGGGRALLFARVIENLRWAVKAKKTLGSDCTIGVGFVVQERNWHEIVQATELAYNIGADNIRISGLFTPSGETYHGAYRAQAEELEKEAMARFDGRNGFRVYGRFHEKMEDLHARPTAPECWYQQVTTYLGADANLYRCCTLAYNRHGLIGNVKEAGGLRRLWESAEKKNLFDLFDARSCARCQFNDRNRAIEHAVRSREVEPVPELQHKNFV